jgi:hypothetical protein
MFERSWELANVSADSLTVRLGVALERWLAPSATARAASCTLYSGSCGSCMYDGMRTPCGASEGPCGGLCFCYELGLSCTGVHLDTCPTGYTGYARWWCCCGGSLVDCTDCSKQGSQGCICQGDYDIAC